MCERHLKCWEYYCLTVFLIIYLPGQNEIVELLLSRGIDVDLPSPLGNPLHVAATHGQDATMKILLEHQADVRRQFVYTHCWMFKRKLGLLRPLYQCISHLSLSCTTM
jgi:hypothetical protein